LNRWQKNLEIGKKCENLLEVWMRQRFAQTNWIIKDTRHIFRDSDNDQYPDYELFNTVSNKKVFFDVKKRNTYLIKGFRYFGYDANYQNSYVNIAKKHNTKVYVGFYDPAFDSSSVYVLDVDHETNIDLVLYFNNDYGRGLACRWRVDGLKKYSL
jgi:hypothetical protein